MGNRLISVAPTGGKMALAEKVLRVYRWPGTIEYAQAYSLQKEIWGKRLNGSSPDTLVLCQHTPTITAGKSGKIENLLVPVSELTRRGVSLFFLDRGGDFTYHGPGQLVAYPILDLGIHGKDVQQYVHNLEEVVIRTLAAFGIEAGRDEQHVGVWVGNEKIAAIGVSIRRWVTMHGMALNVNTDMEYFSLINPCGIREKGVTSMAKLLMHEVPMVKVADKLLECFISVFGISSAYLAEHYLEAGS